VRFTDADVTRTISRYLRTRDAVAAAALETITGSEIRRDTGSHCERPLSCEFRTFFKQAEAMPLLSWSGER
jgi:hypothetical protein